MRKKRGRSDDEGDELRTRALRVRHFMNARRKRARRRTYAVDGTFMRAVNVVRSKHSHSRGRRLLEVGIYLELGSANR